MKHKLTYKSICAALIPIISVFHSCSNGVNETATPSTGKSSDGLPHFAEPSGDRPGFVSDGTELGLTESPIPDLNSNGFDQGDYARVASAFRLLTPIVQFSIPSAYGSFLANDGKLEVGSDRKNGRLEMEDFLPAFRHYVSNGYYYSNHAWGSARFGRQLIDCLNSGSRCTGDTAQIKALDVNMDGRINALDPLVVSNFQNCIDKIRSSSGLSENTFYKYVVKLSDLELCK